MGFGILGFHWGFGVRFKVSYAVLHLFRLRRIEFDPKLEFLK